MKRKLEFIFLIFSIFLLTACKTVPKTNDNPNKAVDKYSGENGKISCKIEKQTQDLSFKGLYIIEYINGITSSVYSREIVTIDDKNSLDNYENKLKEKYSVYNDIDYYEYDVTKTGNKVIGTSSINYKKIDLDKLEKITNQKISNETLKVNKIIETYKIQGAICEEE